MRTFKLALICLIALLFFAAPIWWYISAGSEDVDPDLPVGMNIDKGDYLRLRDEYFALVRGGDSAQPDSRGRAIREMEASERALAARGDAVQTNAWRALGPAPIPNGQVTGGGTIPVSGRTIAIAVDPADPNIVYTGTAQGGLYRSLDGGSIWTPLMDAALTLEIGAIAMVPSDSGTLYIGTGEAGFCGDCFFGVGVYRIAGAASANPVLSGPFNLDSTGADIFTGRAIGKIVVHPTDPNIIYVTTTSGQAGIHGSTTGATLPARGLYRSTNALSANPVFEKVTVSAAGTDRPLLDAVFEPGDPNRLFVTLVDSFAPNLNDGGVYFSSNALAATPTFTRVLTTGAGAELGRAELAIQKTGNTVTVYCANGTGAGQVHKAVYDTTAPGTPSFTMTVDNNFCSPQCFYDQAIAVDPNDATRVYLGGSPALAFGFSTNGGTSFTNSSNTLHVDTHVIAVAPSTPSTLYFGSDGGIWKSINSGATWVSQNNSTYSATQFVSIALHPNDRNYTLGGTQDNGTEYLFPDGTTWTRAVAGDGGHVVIDSGSASPTSLTSYHTFFNQTNTQIGFARSTTTQGNGAPNYGGLLGCGGTANGISCADATLFYAPLVLGPNAPGSVGNTVYFGSNKLYRSINQGTTMTVVSQTLAGANERVSAIAISRQNDDIRLIGSTLGRVYYSNTAAATTMTDVTGTIPGRLVGRLAIDPSNPNIAYAALGGFGIPGQHVMKTTNLSAGTPTWTDSGSGIPDIPTNNLVIDPSDPQTLYAATDIGVFKSSDGGTSWIPFSTGLPRVAVFGMEIQPLHKILKIATHGRGMYELDLSARSGAVQSDFDGDGKSDISLFRGSDGNWYRRNSGNGSDAATAWGLGTDVITPGDYDGDGKTDLAVFRPTGGFWFVNKSTGGFTQTNFGLATDLPTQGDYDGDGKTDLAVFRPSTGEWYLNRSTAGFTVVPFGSNGDRPVPGDYDADGKTDVAVFRPSDGIWYILRSTAGFTALQFGLATDKVIPADYDADGKTDIAIWRPSTGQWFMLRSTAGLNVQPWGVAGDIPTPGDYDGDGKADVSVFRPSDGVWYRLNSLNGSFFQLPYGSNGDRPVPAAYVPVQ